MIYSVPNQMLRQYDDDIECQIKNYLTDDRRFPNTIFHYTSLRGFSGIVESRQLWFSEADLLNDYSEGTYLFEFLRHILYTTKRYAKAFTNMILREIDNPPYHDAYPEYKIFICCFSYNRDSLPMWNYYAKDSNQHGVNIEYDTFKTWKIIDKFCIDNDLFREKYLVCYDEKLQKEFLFKVLDMTYVLWRNFKDKDIVRYMLGLLNTIKYAFKHYAFKTEDEIRFVVKMYEKRFEDEIRKKYPEFELVKVRSNNGFFVPYIEMPFTKECVYSIATSPLIKDYAQIDSMKMYMQKHGFGRNFSIIPSNIPLRF